MKVASVLGVGVASAAALTVVLAGQAVAAPPFTATVGDGVQIYACDAATSTYKLNRPEATLRATTGDTIAHGAGPSWSAPDGSSVTGTVTQTIAQGAGDIPELVLTANNNSAPGTLFAGVTTIRRTNTSGGVGPSGTACVPGTDPEVREPYSATYVFE